MNWARKEAARIRAASARTQPLFLILDFNNPEHPNDGHTWHRTGARLDELARQARYAPDTLTKEDILALAGIASSYRALVSKPGPIRDAVCARMREFDDGEGGAAAPPLDTKDSLTARTIDMLRPEDREVLLRRLARPGASVVIVGPTCSGKTELARDLCEGRPWVHLVNDAPFDRPKRLLLRAYELRRAQGDSLLFTSNYEPGVYPFPVAAVLKTVRYAPPTLTDCASTVDAR